MYNVKLYHSSNSLQKRGAEECLEQYAGKMIWKTSDRIIDIGCGDGSVTMNILKKFIPEPITQLLGSDLSEKMVDFANAEYKTDNITFSVLDITSDLPTVFKESFNHVFSFYTLHWIKDQQTAFTNIYNLLKKDGDCLLVFLGHMPIFDVFRVLSKTPEWHSYLKDVEVFVSPYHDSKDPEKDVENLMTNIGFDNIKVEVKQMSFAFNDISTCKKSVSAVNPFVIPSQLQENFLDDYVKILKNMHLIHKNNINNNDEAAIQISADYKLIVAYATKNEN